MIETANSDRILARLVKEETALQQLSSNGQRLLETLFARLKGGSRSERGELEGEFTQLGLHATPPLSQDQLTVLLPKIQGAALEALSQETAASRPVDQLFLAERAALRGRLESDPALQPFRALSDAWLTFLWGEKTRLNLKADQRIVLNERNERFGYDHDYNCKEDPYHPRHLTPFPVKGVWVPESEGQFFRTGAEPCPLVRDGAGGKEILFLVHPKSEHLYGPLIAKYKESLIEVPALALSSFRSLLVALPTGYALVKVSIDEKIGGAVRILAAKECGGSVGTTAVLKQKRANVQFLQEDMSFVPSSALMDGQYSDALEKGAGMIHRVIPECLLRTQPNQYILPAFSLYGAKNRQLLELLIQQSKMTPTQFLQEQVLKPLAELFVQLIYTQHLSLEAHGQNLLLAIDTSDPEKVKIQFLYRDMGGVNCDFSSAERALLPENAADNRFYYLESHAQDTAYAMEMFSRRVLFNLTKSFFKNDWKDPEFEAWKATVPSKYWPNWHVEDADPDRHLETQPQGTFYCYGYCERLFAKLWLDAMGTQGIFPLLFEVGKPKTARDYYEERLARVDNPYDPSIGLQWFEHLIKSTYPAYKALF